MQLYKQYGLTVKLISRNKLFVSCGLQLAQMGIDVVRKITFWW